MISKTCKKGNFERWQSKDGLIFFKIVFYRYQVDEVYYIEEMAFVLKKAGPSILLTLGGRNCTSGEATLEANFDGISDFAVNNQELHHAMCELRVIKTSMELDVLKYAARVSSEAHKAVMRKIKPGMKEYMCEAIFLYEIYFNGGCRHSSFTSICGGGHSSAVLHFDNANAPNDQDIKDGDIVLFDMGGQYYGYCSDITCSYPVNGKFSEKQKIVYNAALAANLAVTNAVKPGVSMLDLHWLSNRVILKHLRCAGILKGDIDDMMKANLAGEVFMPHGVGHFVGLDVVDVGGYNKGHPERPTLAGARELATGRTLMENMVIAIEPGCYFDSVLVDKALSDPVLSQFVAADELNGYRGFGGARVESTVIITKDGCENMVSVPRTVEEIEGYMAGKDKT